MFLIVIGEKVEQSIELPMRAKGVINSLSIDRSVGIAHYFEETGLCDIDIA
jgi:hypothetical protein